MIIDMLTRWLNFEFGVLSHLKKSAYNLLLCKPCCVELFHSKFVWFTPMVAPSSDQRQKA